MCLITEQKEPIILKEDLVVYKEIIKVDETECETLYQYGYTYIKDEVRNTDIIVHTNVNEGFDIDAVYDDLVLIIVPTISKNCIERQEAINSGLLVSISQGYHFMVEPQRSEDYKKITIYHSFNKYIGKFIIPSGSEVYFDGSGLGVSNSIKFVGYLEE